MNCDDAETQIFAARDAPRGAAAAAILEQHLAECPRCQRLAAGLTAAAHTWRQTDQQVTVPDAQTEWHAVRRRIRNSTTTTSTTGGLPSWRRLLRFALPIAGAGVIAIGLSIRWAEPPAEPAMTPVAQADWSHFDDPFTRYAHAEYVETDDEDLSPFVYVDEESGWLIVWASEVTENPSI